MDENQNPSQFTPQAITVLEDRYLMKNEIGEIVESAEGLFRRVANAISSIEKRSQASWADRFFNLMHNRFFLPNSPTLMNAGKMGGQLSACYVLPIDDSLESIFDTLKYAAKIHQSGGGTGFSFSKLRPAGSPVRSTHGVASGPVSFIKIFDVTTETIKQGGARRGANMAVLNVEHADILEFIRSKVDQASITNFNISVGITDSFMDAYYGDQDFVLKSPFNRRVKTVRARAIMDEIVKSAWKCGDPGLIFLDRINVFNPTPSLGRMESTNPCGEQPLLPYESCNLGSLNLGLYVEQGVFNWKKFGADIETAVRFLDNVIDLNHFPVLECRKITLKNRKIGLGVMGFADLLLMMNLPYGSGEAQQLGERIMSFLDRQAKLASQRLAKERGSFPNWERSMWSKLGYPKLRNATLTTVAPTGTISIIAGASSGIEPLFSGIYYRNVLDGKRLKEVHPGVTAMLRTKGFAGDEQELTDEKIREYLGPVFSPTRFVSVENHVRMQAMFQRHSDSAVSKTINLPVTATEEDVRKAYILAYELGCKGITVYRDQSRSHQVLESPLNRSIPDERECPIC